MYQISENVGHVVAADTQGTVKSINEAIVNQSRMCATLVEASTAANLPVGAMQESLRAVTEGLQNLVVNRARIEEAVRELSEIQRLSNLREVSFGCPTGPYTFFTTASAEPEATSSE
jgi:hypothetical protein